MLTTEQQLDRPVEVACGPASVARSVSPVAMRNVRTMHLLDRIAARFDESGIALMALGGTALNLVLDLQPDALPVNGLDLMVRAGHVHDAAWLLEDLGCLRSEVRYREDLFPKYDNAVEFTAGSIDPIPVNLHVRPFRPARYARLVPDDAMWQRAETVDHGNATVLAPSREDLLLYLAVRSAVGGNARLESFTEIKRLIRRGESAIDWDRFLDRVESWRLGLPVRSAMTATEIAVGQVCPPGVRRRLAGMPARRIDRLTLRHATRESVAVTLLTAPGWLYKFSFLRDILFHDRSLRCRRIAVRESGIHGRGVFAKRAFAKGAVIGRYRGRPADHDGPYVVWRTDESGKQTRHEITGPLRFLNHSCRPLAKLDNFRLVAVRSIRRGREITIDYGTCKCRRVPESTDGQ